MSREKPDVETRLRYTPGKKIHTAIDVLNEIKNEIQEEKRKYIRALKDYELMSEKDQKLVHDLANKGMHIRKAINCVLTGEKQSYRYDV